MPTPANITRARKLVSEWLKNDAGIAIKMTMTHTIYGALVGRVAEALDEATSRADVSSGLVNRNHGGT